MFAMAVLTYIVEIVLGIGFIIFIHEMGHFFAAKWIGARVRRFYLGFAPRIKIAGRSIPLRLFAFKRGGTEYGVGLVPLGGFVDIEGQDPSKPLKGTKDEFLSKKPWQRAVVFVAGSFMNAASAFVLFVIAFAVGVSFVKPVIGGLEPGGAAWRAGLAPGEHVVAIDGEPVEDFQELWTRIALGAEGVPVVLTVEGDGGRRDVTLKPEPDRQGRGLSIGVTSVTTRVEAVMDGSAAERAGIEPHWRLRAVTLDDRLFGVRRAVRIRQPGDFRALLALHVNAGDSLLLEFDTESGPRTVTVTTDAHPGTEKTARIGVLVAENMTIRAIRLGSPLSEWLKSGDRVRAVAGREVYCPAGLLAAALEAASGAAPSPVPVEVVRAGAPVTMKIDAELLARRLESDLAFESWPAGMRPPPVIGFVRKGSAAEAAGLTPGSRIVELGGRPVAEFADLVDAVRATGGRPAPISWVTPDGGKRNGSISPKPSGLARVGLAFGPERFVYRASLFSAVALGVKRTLLWAKRVFLVIEGLFTRTVEPKHLSGPVGIISVSYIVARFGVGTLIYFLALISINLAIVNMLPIPILDGGHLLFLGIEKLRRRPLSLKTQTIAQLAGLAFFIFLILFVTYHDIARLIRMP